MQSYNRTISQDYQNQKLADCFNNKTQRKQIQRRTNSKNTQGKAEVEKDRNQMLKFFFYPSFVDFSKKREEKLNKKRLKQLISYCLQCIGG